MKTSEFIKEIENIGKDNGFIYVLKNDSPLLDSYDRTLNVKFNNNILIVGIDRKFLEIKLERSDDVCEEFRKLLSISIEYHNTSLKEREDEKKYKLKLKGIKEGNKELYLCMYDFGSELILVHETFIKGNKSDDEFYYIFSQSEIDDLPEEIKKHNWEYVEVEE